MCRKRGTLMRASGGLSPHVSSGAVCRKRGTGANGGDDRDRTDDPLLAKQVLSQLSYAPNRGNCLNPEPGGINLVGQGGLEPPTPRLSSVCSNQLSY